MGEYDVVICGAGVGGLTLARALGQQGRRVLLVDKRRTDPPVHKGELLQPRSVQILAALGALDRLRAAGALTAGRLACRTATGAEVGVLDYGCLPEPYRYCLVHYYAEIKAALAADLGGTVEFRRGARVAGLLRDAAGRVGGVRLADGTGVPAALSVAADGHSSPLRAAAAISVPRYRYDHELLGLDLSDVDDLGSDVVAYLTGGGLRLLFAMPGRRARLYVQLPAGRFRTLGRGGLPAWAARLPVEVPALAPVAAQIAAAVPTAQVMPAWRFNAPTWFVPGLALVGDAAHCVHPMAGQGMNAAIADAWALAGQLDDLGPPALDAALERYDAHRRPRLEYVSRLSHNLATLFTDLSWRGRVVGRRMLERNRGNQRLQYVITYNMSGLGVRRFTVLDRLVQFGLLADPRARRTPEPLREVSWR